MESKTKVTIISSSTRPGRKGPIIGRWITEYIGKHYDVLVTFIDLGEMNLPMMDEPNHPRLRQYQHEHTKKWSTLIDDADAYVFVLAEYNTSMPAPLKNALDYVLHEWSYKAAGIVSYGGVSGGSRASNSLKNVLSTLKVVPLFEAVHIPFFTQFIKDDIFVPNEPTLAGAKLMMSELLKWTKALKQMREK